MTLKHKFTEVLRSGRIVPKLVWDILKDLDIRLTAIEHVGTSELDDASVTAAKINMFYSTEQTANGSAQDVPHGLGVSPSKVVIIPSATLAGATGFSYTKGSVNIVVTGTNTAKYYVLAIA